MSKDFEPGADFINLNKHIQVNLNFEGKHRKPIMRYSLK